MLCYPCYAMLSPAMLCYPLLCYVLRYVILCYALLCSAFVRAGATLVFKDMPLSLSVQGIRNLGTLIMGSEACPIRSSVTVTFTGNRQGTGTTPIGTDPTFPMGASRGRFLVPASVWARGSTSGELWLGHSTLWSFEN